MVLNHCGNSIFKNVKKFLSSTLRVERRKWGNADGREVRRTRSKVIASCRARVLIVRDNAQSRSPSAKCCELYASLYDRFRFEVRILFYPIRTWKWAAWVTRIIAGMRVVSRAGEGVQVDGRAGVRGALSRNELKMFREQILSRNEAWFVKIRKQMTTAHTRTHTLARIVAGISPEITCWPWFCPPLRLIPVCLNSPFPILTKPILSHYFYISTSNTERREVVFCTLWLIGQ